jgi:hypothetical protein
MAREALAFALAFLGLICALHLCTGCKPVEAPIEGAAAVAQYEAQLDACRKRGKESRSYAIYEECAAAVDRDLCATRGLRCIEGGQ